MTKEELKNLLTELFPGTIIEENAFVNLMLPDAHISEVCKKLRQHNQLQFDFLVCASGVDWKTHLSMVYHLRSMKFRHEMVVKTKIENYSNPVTESVGSIWETAWYHEREAFDFFGIIFQNHPDLRRLFNPDDWSGYPLLKNYADEINIVEL